MRRLLVPLAILCGALIVASPAGSKRAATIHSPSGGQWAVVQINAS